MENNTPLLKPEELSLSNINIIFKLYQHEVRKDVLELYKSPKTYWDDACFSDSSEEDNNCCFGY